MDICKFCQGKVVEVSPGLFKCIGICGQYFPEDKEVPPKLTIVSSVDTLRAHEAGVEVGEGGGLSVDMLTFISRVAEALAPTAGLDEDGTVRALKIQEDFRRELVEVFQGGEDYDKWYSRTKTKLGLHPQKFMTILYQCLEGLRSPEAQELRADYAQAIRKMAM